MIVTRAKNTQELDLLLGKERETFILTDLDNKIILQIESPSSGWTHDLLEMQELQLSKEIWSDGWNAFLGGLDYWIGSSEL